MLQVKLLILTSIYASEGNVEQLKKLYGRFVDSKDFINIIIIFWPEFLDCLTLSFLLEEVTPTENSNSDILVDFIAQDPKLISVLEMDDDVIYQRYDNIQKYIEDQFNQLQLNSDLHWLQKRIIWCNEFDSTSDVLTYAPLWKLILGQDEKLDEWINGLILPLAHLNYRISQNFRILDFENKLDKHDILNYVANDCNESVLQSELIPLIKYNKEFYDIFLVKFYDTLFFPLDNLNSFNQLVFLYDSLKENFGSDIHRINQLTLSIVFQNSSNFQNTISMEDVHTKILNKMDENVKLESYDITNKDLKQFADFITSWNNNFSLIEVYTISQEEKSAQLSHFHILCEDTINKDRKMINELLLPMEIFNKLKDDAYVRFNELVNTIIDLNELDLLSELQIDPEFKEKYLESLISHFWQFFNNATNSHTREMLKAKKILQIIMTISNGFNVHELESIIKVNDKLLNSEISIKLNKKLPFKPSNILDFKNRPLELFTILLENNNNMYSELDTFSIPLLKDLSVALSIKDETLKRKLISLHIDFALVNTDFQFAYEISKKLLDGNTFAKDNNQDSSNSFTDTWSSILQVSKYQDPSWNETPTDILTLQVNLLSKLIKNCPIEEIDNIVSQWSALELELTSRDIINE